MKRLFQNSFFQGSVAFTIASFIVNLLNYFFNIVVAKKLGPVGFGEVSALFSYLAIFSIPMLVMNMVVIQKIGAHRKNQMRYAASIEHWFLTKISKWWPAAALCFFFYPVLQNYSNLSSRTAWVILPLIILGTVGAFYSAIFQGIHRLALVSVVSVIVVSVKLLSIALPAPLGGSLFTISIGLLFAAVLQVAIQHRALHASAANGSSQNRGEPKRILHVIKDRQFVITLVSLLSLTLIGNFDIVVAKKILSPHDVGIYSSWVLFSKIILYALGPLLTTTYIYFSSKKSETHHDWLLFIALALFFIIGVAASFIYGVFGGLIIKTLFSASFLKVSSLLGLAGIHGTLYTLITFLNNYLLSRKSLTTIYIAAAGLVYVGAVSMFGSSISMLIGINISTASAILLIQFIGVIQYNYARWTTNKLTTS